METTAVHFANAARVLANAARLLDLAAPGFRSPPRLDDADRSLRGRGADAVISVRLAHRPWPAVLADLVDGVVAANELGGSAAGRARAALWDSLADAGLIGESTTAHPPARPLRAPVGGVLNTHERATRAA
jgi:hypothetical protein